MRFALSTILPGASPATAGFINKPAAGVYDGGHAQTGVSNSYSGPAGSADLSVTTCFGGFCPGEAIPGTGPSYNVADPLNMRLAGALLQCDPISGCAGTAVFVDFSFIATTTARFGQFIPLPNSLDVNLVDTAVPEPAALGLMALGLAAPALGRKGL